MQKTVIAVGVVISLLTAAGCSGSAAEDDSPPPAGGINGPAIVDPDVLIGPSDDSDG